MTETTATPMPKHRTLAITLESGELVQIKAFSAFQVLEDDRIAQSFADIYDTAKRLGERSMDKYRAAAEKAGVTLEEAASMSDAEAMARGLTVEQPSLAQILAACRAPLSRLVRAALANREDAWFHELGADELLQLVAAVYQVNVERYEGKLQEALAKVAKSLQGAA